MNKNTREDMKCVSSWVPMDEYNKFRMFTRYEGKNPCNKIAGFIKEYNDERIMLMPIRGFEKTEEDAKKEARVVQGKPVTDKQKGFIERLCGMANKEVPDNIEKMTTSEANIFIRELKAEIGLD